MQELRGYISTFAASGVGASYTELYDSPASVSEPLAYLSQKFPTLDTSKLSAIGYGSAVPVAPNTSAAGRARNRRIEFKVTNTDELKIERTKRGLSDGSAAPPADSTK